MTWTIAEYSPRKARAVLDPVDSSTAQVGIKKIAWRRARRGPPPADDPPGLAPDALPVGRQPGRARWTAKTVTYAAPLRARLGRHPQSPGSIGDIADSGGTVPPPGSLPGSERGKRLHCKAAGTSRHFFRRAGPPARRNGLFRTPHSLDLVLPQQSIVPRGGAILVQGVETDTARSR